MTHFHSPSQSINPKFCHSLQEISAKYTGFIIDLWGVLHDGHQLFPWSQTCIKALKASGKKIVFLSNSPRRSEYIRKDLRDKGLSPAEIDHVHTSGEETYLQLAQNKNLRAQIGKKCLAIGYTDEDEGLMTPLGITRTDNADEADFICVFRSDPNVNLHDFKVMVRPYIEKGTPLLCPNPDVSAIHNGKKTMCPGAYGEIYSQCGGDVLMYGKPYQVIYQRVLKQFHTWGIPDREILCIGDLLETDILGARGSHLSSALVMSGVHGYNLDLQNKDFTPESQATILNLCHNVGTYPDYILPKLR